MEDWKNKLGDMVFSTGTNESESKEEFDEDSDLIPAGQQSIRIWLDRKSRRGKSVTLIKGFEGREEELNALARTLKKLCGVGGSTKYGEIIIQGDQRKKIQDYMISQGFSDCKLSGG